MPLALSKVGQCNKDDLATKTNSFGSDEKFELDFHGEKIRPNAEETFPHLLTDEYIGDVCYLQIDGKKKYYFTSRAWGAMQHELIFWGKNLNAGAAKTDTDILEALRGKEEPIDVPLEAFGVDSAAVATMAKDEPPLIDADYDTEDWKAVPYYLPPEFIAALRAALRDTDNELFKTTGTDGIYYVTKKIDRKFYLYPEDAKGLARIVNELSEVKAWFEREIAKDANAPKETLEKLAKQRDNVLVVLNKFEEILRETNQVAAEERSSWNMNISFGMIIPLMGALVYGIMNSFKKKRNGNGELLARLERLESDRLDRFEKAMNTFMAGLDGGRPLTERDMISVEGLEGEELEKAQRYNEQLKNLEEGRRRALEAREALLKARATARKGKEK